MGAGFQMVVRLFSSQEPIVIQVEEDNTILEVKQMVFEKMDRNEDYSPVNQRLHWAGRGLEEERTIGDYEINNSLPFILVLRLRIYDQ